LIHFYKSLTRISEEDARARKVGGGGARSRGFCQAGSCL